MCMQARAKETCDRWRERGVQASVWKWYQSLASQLRPDQLLPEPVAASLRQTAAEVGVQVVWPPPAPAPVSDSMQPRAAAAPMAAAAPAADLAAQQVQAQAGEGTQHVEQQVEAAAPPILPAPDAAHGAAEPAAAVAHVAAAPAVAPAELALAGDKADSQGRSSGDAPAPLSRLGLLGEAGVDAAAKEGHAAGPEGRTAGAGTGLEDADGTAELAVEQAGADLLDGSSAMFDMFEEQPMDMVGAAAAPAGASAPAAAASPLAAYTAADWQVDWDGDAASLLGCFYPLLEVQQAEQQMAQQARPAEHVPRARR